MITKSENLFPLERAVLLAIYGLIVLSFAGFFVFATGKANNFPTYFAGLLTLFFLAINRVEFKVIRHSAVLNLAFVFVAYMAFSSIWSDSASLESVLGSFASSALIITLLVGMLICSRRFPDFMPTLVYGIVFFATISAVHFLIFNADLATPKGAWGRLHAPSVAGLVFGLAAVMAIWSVVHVEPVRWKLLAAASATVLVASCLVIDINYISFALGLASIVIVGFYTWYKVEGRWFYGFVALLPVVMVLFFVFESEVLSDRQAIWAPVLDLVFESQSFFGHGILSNVTPTVDCTDNILLAANGCIFDHPHNIYVSTLYQGGIVGLVLLILLLILSVSMTLGTNDKSLVMLVLACLTYGSAVLMFDGHSLIKKVNFLWLVFWLPIGMAIVCEVLSFETTDTDFHDGQERL